MFATLFCSTEGLSLKNDSRRYRDLEDPVFHVLELRAYVIIAWKVEDNSVGQWPRISLSLRLAGGDWVSSDLVDK